MISYEQALERLKAAILPIVVNATKNEAAERKILAQSWADKYYSIILALGYNNNDEKKAIEDLMESPMIDIQIALENLTSAEDYINVLSSRINYIRDQIPSTIAAGARFHHLSQNGYSLESAVSDALTIL